MSLDLKSILKIKGNKLKILLMIIFSTSVTFGQVNLKINPDILVKTNNGSSIRIDGNLIEEDSGYLHGNITSSYRTDLTEFAGLSINPGFDGAVSRVTGESYSKGNGELPNFKRYYEINNTGVSDITTSMEMEFRVSGEFNERNNISAPYHIYSYSTDWLGYGDGSSNPPVVANNVKIPTGLSDWIISDNSGVVTVEETELLPEKFELFQNYPNPFNPETVIKFSIPEIGNVRLSVFSILGEKVVELVNETLSAGYHKVTFNSNNLGSGTYIYKIEVNNFLETKKMILLK